MVSPEVQNPINPELEHFNGVIRKVADHMFTTTESRQKRAEIDATLKDFNETFEDVGIQEKAFFPAGSVGSGMARAHSDLEGTFAYTVNEGVDTKRLSSQLNVLSEMDEFKKLDIMFEQFERMTSLPEDQVKLGLEQHSMHLEGFAQVFTPSLNELTDPQEKVLVNSWRQKALQNLVRKYPNEALEIWEKVREELDLLVVHYEYQDYGHDQEEPYTTKRHQRVEQTLRQIIQNRFPDDPEKQKRAYDIIQAKRDAFKYPTLEQMCKAFEVNWNPSQTTQEV